MVSLTGPALPVSFPIGGFSPFQPPFFTGLRQEITYGSWSVTGSSLLIAGEPFAVRIFLLTVCRGVSMSSFPL